ncbi:MAG: hypothetical protein Q4F05_16945 [bacterium]|nr:hypothetical protein [bacterium]
MTYQRTMNVPDMLLPMCYEALGGTQMEPCRDHCDYLPIVGYDEENFYATELLSNMKNAEAQYYNRKIAITDFEKMCSTGIIEDNTYLILKLKK